MIRLLTDSKNPIVVRRRRFWIYFLIGGVSTTAFALAISFLGTLCIAMPLSAVFTFLVATKASPIAFIALTAVATMAIWVGQYFIGRSYMEFVSRLGFEHRKEVLTPIFLPSLAIWSLIAGSVLFTAGFNYGTIAIIAGIGFHILGQRQRMMVLRRALPNDAPITKLESGGEFLDQLFDLKTAESIEHLEQLSKQCLVLIKPSAASSDDCTSALINELMRRKLSIEADELSALQLKLIDRSEH